MDADRLHVPSRVTVKEAADWLGISPEAVRARIKRGTLRKDKDADGTVYVWLYADQAHQDGDGTNDGTNAQPLMVARLENEIEFLRKELERKDTILLNMTEAMKALNPPPDTGSPEAREAPVSASESGDGTQQAPSDTEQRSWWQRWFGL